MDSRVQNPVHSRSELLARLEGSRLALLGLGVENRALAHFLLARDISFSVCDARAPADVEALRRQWGGRVFEWRLGEDYLEGLDDFEVLLRTPGLPFLHPRLQEARARGVQISSQTHLFFALSPLSPLGVTGTKGKGTTTSLLADLLAEGPPQRVFAGGNIGRPPISFLDELRAGDQVLLELSSFQLQDLKRSPHIAVVLAVAQDHLDHHADRREYVEAKKSICRYQGEEDWLVFDQDCPTARSFAAESPARKAAFSIRGEVETGAWVEGETFWLRRPGQAAEAICPLSALPLRGRHNRSNAAAALTAAALLGAPGEQLGRRLMAFRGLEHRLEEVGTFAGVRYYNDSLATTPEAAMAAIDAFAEPLLLIAGGASKGADFAALGARIAASAHLRALILIGQEAPRIRQAVVEAGGFKGEIVSGCTDMRAAVQAARKRAQAGDVVLLSPACSSFDMFANYKERGEAFRRAAAEAQIV